jgi:hypothetical protein
VEAWLRRQGLIFVLQNQDQKVSTTCSNSRATS